MDNNNLNYIPMLPLRGVVAFPNIVLHFDVARKRSVRAVKEAMNGDRKIFLITQRDVFVEEPKISDLYKIGVVCEVKQFIKTKEGVTRVLVEGLHKAKMVSLYDTENMFYADVKLMNNYARTKYDESEIDAVIRSVKDAFSDYASYMPKMPSELLSLVMNQPNPFRLFESIVFNTAFSYEIKQQLLEAGNIITKLTMLYSALCAEIEILSIEKEIRDKVKENIDRSQHEYYLREQMNVIAQQLGEDDNVNEEVISYIDRICKIGLSEKDTEKLIKEADRLMKMPANSQEAFVIRNYLDTVLDLPWNKYSSDKIDIEKARKTLDKDHFGMEKVKERILETISVQSLSDENPPNIICLVGPPGVGKTSIGKSVAKALGRKYVRVSLGGVKDEADIRGHRKTYIGSMPGRILNAISKAGTMNPLILLDEIDKMSNDFKGDPASAMLEVLDSEQNCEFRDHYLEIPFDLSKVMFVTTANVEGNIPEPLHDRMEIIELSSYTREEKFNIAKKHLVPKMIKANGLKKSQLKISDDVLYMLIDSYTREAGVRTLERTISKLCRKAAKEIVENSAKSVKFTIANIENYLGVRKYHGDERSEKDQIGVVNGLAWTASGGVLMPLEALVLEGKGAVELTGSLGDVMKESAKLAVSWCRFNSNEYSIDPQFYKNNDIHIHAPEGAVPKDGPSAGVTMITAMVSALSKTPVRCDVAMTGEITLHGKVLPIGGLREKSMAAYRNGIKTVIAPAGNRPDLEEVDETVKQNVDFVFVSSIDEVLKIALCRQNEGEDEQYILPQSNKRCENLLTV
ncbi:MAG: endopeptidase La [Oscillospiraceae bacterium]|nr:endopeptidase La [Oscillospiraceae bacterium]